MFNRKTLHVTLMVFLTFGMLTKVMGQDPQFSQFYANPLYTNPAFAGSEICPRIVMNYRNQWASLPGSYTTYSISADQYVDFLKGGVGVQVFQDNAGNGTIKTFNAALSYAYTLRLNKQVALKFGAEAAYWQKSLEWDQLTFGDMIDERYGFIYTTNEPFGDSKVNAPDFSAGMLLYSKSWYVGGAVHHLAEPVESFFGSNEAVLYRRYTFQAGGTIALDKKHPEAGSISPSFLFMQQGPSQQFNLGMYGRMSVFTVGFWYRFNGNNGDALVALVGIQTDDFKFGYSYDITVSRLTNATGGAHELSLGIQLKCRKKRPRYSPPPCPQW